MLESFWFGFIRIIGINVVPSGNVMTLMLRLAPSICAAGCHRCEKTSTVMVATSRMMKKEFLRISV